MMNRDTVTRQFHGFATHDMEAIMATIADDCVYEEHEGPEPYGRRFSGKDAIRRAFEAIFARAPRCTFKDPLLVIEGDRAVAKWTFVLSPDEPVELEGIDLFELRNGKVVRKQSWLKALQP